MTSLPEAGRKLLERVRAGDALIGIIGMGYVGLPLAVAFGEAGARVLGFDIDAEKARAINEGRSYIKHIEDDRLAGLRGKGALEATADLDRLDEPDVLLICVPTPLSRHLEPDLHFVVQTTEDIARRLRPGQIVILESTTYPGTTSEVVRPIMEAGGLVAGRDVFLAYSPEREDPGNMEFNTARIPKVVGADDALAAEIAAAVYRIFAPEVVMVSSAAAAEAVKITENVFRAVNIALVNELKVVFDAMNINIWEVIDAAKTKPFGFMAFYPGPGIGGHCIPIDPFYLTWKAREYNQHTHFIELAGEINRSMPNQVVRVLSEALDARLRRGLNGSRILVLGVAYKKNIDDIRESPSLRLIELLEQRGARTDYFDPFVPVIAHTREHAELAGRASIDWNAGAISEYDAVLIATDHDGVDYRSLADWARLVVDTRNACARAGADMARVVRA